MSDIQQHPHPSDDRQPETLVRVSVHADAGAQPAGRSAQLVEEALQDCDASPGTPVSVAVPAGDGAMVARLHDLLDEQGARRAGATVIVDGVLTGED
jgi:hypothetical protein